MPLEIAMDLAKLALFDVRRRFSAFSSLFEGKLTFLFLVFPPFTSSRRSRHLYACERSLTLQVIIYADDSGSMQFEEGGSRIDDLKLVLERCAFAASLFDDDGSTYHDPLLVSAVRLLILLIPFLPCPLPSFPSTVQVRFMNSRVEGNGIRSQQDAMNLVSQVRFSGCVFLFIPPHLNVDRFLLPASLPSVPRSTRKCCNRFSSVLLVLDASTSLSLSSPSLTVRSLSLFFPSSL
jgi:hypothetical protein